jgi:hypothetical protein
MLPGERIDLIRAIYSSLKDRETVDVTLILREFGIEVRDPEYWAMDAASYVQEMLRRSDDDTLVSLRDYVGGEVLERPVSAEAQRRIWSDGFRLFITHTAAHASYVSRVKKELKELGISAFVAHTDIEPPRDGKTKSRTRSTLRRHLPRSRTKTFVRVIGPIKK